MEVANRNCINPYINSCRICLIKEGYISIFADVLQGEVEINIREVFEICTNLEVQEMDDMPKNLCDQCFFELLKTNQFLLKCKESNKILLHSLIIKDVKENQINRLRYEDPTVVDYGDALSINENYNSTPVVDDLRIEHDNSKGLKLCNGNNDSILLDYTDSKQNISAITCNVCGRTFLNKARLNKHLLSHTKDKPHLCDFCPAGFSSRSNLYRHMQSHSGFKKYICRQCNKGFTTKFNYIDHMNKHNGLKAYLCEICGEQFFTYNPYKAHVNSHAEHSCSNLKKCSLCQESVSSNNALKRHMKIQHTKKRLICHICGDQFSKKTTLKIHQRKHTGEKPYKCSVCHKDFAHESTFKVHKRVHTGEKPHKCSICGKAFTQKTHLNTHMNHTHKKLKPHSCPYCEKKFADKGNLTVHIRIHTGEKPHTCSICQKGFYTTTALKKHKNIHGNYVYLIK